MQVMNMERWRNITPVEQDLTLRGADRLGSTDSELCTVRRFCSRKRPRRSWSRRCNTLLTGTSSKQSLIKPLKLRR